MKWIQVHGNYLRGIALGIFVLLGPWTYDSLYVPARYECSSATFRISSDFCGLPMSGVRTFEWLVTGLLAQLSDFHAFPVRLSNFIYIVFFVFPILPFASNLLMISKRNPGWLQRTNLVLWGIACMLALPVVVVLRLEASAGRLWGLWLYTILTFWMLVVELFILKRGSGYQR
jgi:hypothetical protein